MTVPANRWKIGLFVVFGALVILMGLTWLGMARMKRSTHEAFVYFDEPVLGLDLGSAVKFRGVPIGKVAGLTLAADRRHLKVRISLDDQQLVELGLAPASFEPDQQMPEGLHATIVTSYLTQTSFVLMDFFIVDPAAELPLPFTPEPNTVRSIRSTFRSLEEGMRDLLRELPSLMTEARKLVSAATADLASLKLAELGIRADNVLVAAERQVRDFDQLPVVTAVTGAFQEIDALAKSLQNESGPVQKLLGELQGLTIDLRSALQVADLAALAKSMRAAGDTAQSAGQNLGALATDMRDELPYLRSALASIERLVDVLQRDPSTLLRGRPSADSPLKK